MFRLAAVRRTIAPVPVVLLVALGGCGDADDAPSDITAAPTTTAALQTTAPATSPPASGSVTPTTGPTTESVTTASTAPPSTAATTTELGPVIQLTVGDEVSRHAVSVGDEVTLVVTGDVTDEVHVHGYDLLAEVRPGRPATVTFVADIPGVWEIELEGAHQLLAELEVR